MTMRAMMMRRRKRIFSLFFSVFLLFRLIDSSLVFFVLSHLPVSLLSFCLCHAQLIHDRKKGSYGFVHMSCMEDAQSALSALDGKKCGNRRLHIEFRASRSSHRSSSKHRARSLNPPSSSSSSTPFSDDSRSEVTAVDGEESGEEDEHQVDEDEEQYQEHEEGDVEEDALNQLDDDEEEGTAAETVDSQLNERKSSQKINLRRNNSQTESRSASSSGNPTPTASRPTSAHSSRHGSADSSSSTSPPACEVPATILSDEDIVSLVVFHLPRDMDDGTLFQLFAPFGKIQSVNVCDAGIDSEMNGRTRACCQLILHLFVRFFDLLPVFVLLFVPYV